QHYRHLCHHNRLQTRRNFHSTDEFKNSLLRRHQSSINRLEAKQILATSFHPSILLLRAGSNRSRRYLTMVVREGSRSLPDSVSFTSTRRSN
ncbi:hypothetical protein T310_9890, partial [Rasamsonia emersonii CBS 393.64]